MVRSLFRAGLMAGLILTLLGPPARAEFSFQIENNPTKSGLKIDETSPGQFTVVAPSGGTLSYSSLSFTKETGSELAGSVTVDGATFKFDVTSNQDTKSSTTNGAVTVAMQVSDTKATNFSFYAADGSFTGANPKAKVLVESVTVNSSGTSASGVGVSGGANLITQHPSLVTWTGVATSNTKYLGAGQSASVWKNVPTTQLGHYYLSGIGGQIYTKSGGGNLSFFASTTLATPEPTGVLLGVLGLPCMAGLIVWARRRRVPVAA